MHQYRKLFALAMVVGFLLSGLFVGSLFMPAGNKSVSTSSPAINGLRVTSIKNPLPNGSSGHFNRAAAKSNIAKIEKNVASSIKSQHVPQRAVFEPNFNAINSPRAGTVSPLYASAPAPMGLADYGLTAAGGQEFNTSSFEATLNLSSYNVFYTGNGQFQESPKWSSVQLNTVLANVTVHGNSSDVFWTQNVIDFNGTTLQFIDNIWNFSSNQFLMTNTTLYSYNGSVIAPTFYYAYGPMFNITYPFKLTLYNNVTVEDNMPALYYNYTLSYGGKTYSGSYDRVLFWAASSAKIVTPHFEVNGNQVTPNGFLLYDAELIFGGPGGGATGIMTNLTGQDTIMYKNSAGTYQTISSAYNYGTDTGETIVGVSSWWNNGSNGAPVEYLGAGPSLLMPFWNAPKGEPKGAMTVTGRLDPSYAFLFAGVYNKTASPVLSVANASLVPTAINGSGYFNFSMPSGGVYELNALANGYKLYTANTTKTDNLGTITMTTDPNNYTTPVYITGNAQLADMKTAGIVTGSGTSLAPYIINDLTIHMNPLFTTYNDYLYPMFVAVQTIGVTSHLVINNVTTNNTAGISYRVFNFGDYMNNLYYLYRSSNITMSNITQDMKPTTNATFMISNTYGTSTITLFRSDNITVENNNISLPIGGSQLIAYLSNYSAVTHNKFTDNVAGLFTGVISNGLFMFRTSHDVVSYNNLSFEMIGVNETYSTMNNIYNNTIGGFSFYGITFTNTTEVMVYNNTINSLIGFNFAGSTGNTIYNNNINSMLDALSILQPNRWNVTERNGTNIIGGPRIGGNYWSNYNTLNVKNGIGSPKFNDYNAIYPGYDYLPLVHAGAPIIFNETGLRAGTLWSVSFNNYLKLSNTNYTVFHVASTTGNLTYIVNIPVGYYLVNPAMGNVTLNGGKQVINLVFEPEYYLNFTETGLPANATWNVTVYNSTRSITNTSMTSTNSILIPNGTYNYTITNVTGYTVKPLSGSVTVKGKNASIPVTFTPVVSPSKYAVTFTESGLASGTSWSVTLNGTAKSSTTGTVTFTEVNGTYSYTVSNVSGYTVSPLSGSVTVSGKNASVPVTFKSKPTVTVVKYAVTFTESGLPSGTNWSVTLNGTTHSINTTAITFTEVNGTYGYTVASVTNYTVTPQSGNVTVNGKNASISVTFTAKKTTSPTSVSGYVYGIIVVVIIILVVIAVIVLMKKKGKSIGFGGMGKKETTETQNTATQSGIGEQQLPPQPPIQPPTPPGQ